MEYNLKIIRDILQTISNSEQPSVCLSYLCNTVIEPNYSGQKCRTDFSHAYISRLAELELIKVLQAANDYGFVAGMSIDGCYYSGIIAAPVTLTQAGEDYLGKLLNDKLWRKVTRTGLLVTGNSLRFILKTTTVALITHGLS